MIAPQQAKEDWRTRLVNLQRAPKRALLMANDFALLLFALWAGFSLRLNEFYLPSDWEFAGLLLAAPVIGVATFNYLGLYRLVTRFIGHRGATRILLAVALAVMIWALVVLLSGVRGVLPRGSIILYGMFSFGFVWASRQVTGWVLRDMIPSLPMNYDPDRANALIYGAGAAGVQLAQALRTSGVYNLIGFVDEDKSLWGQNVAGLKVYRPLKVSKLVARDGVKEVLLAVPDASRRRRRTIIRRLERFAVKVKTLPAIADIATGRVSVSDLRPVDVEDLLGRDPVPPDVRLLARDIEDRAVMVTGSGGSIGSELSRQICALRPKRLVLFELSEIALYEIEAELAGIASDDTEIVSVLGSVLDGDLMRQTLTRYGVQTIYHAAAYKHVPIVELNPITGLRNNTFGTAALAYAARDVGVERFVLISTDKAVRPTNVMGASKRVAEMILQALANQPNGGTVFTMVRFGNVLDSSGSVVRRFRKQIVAGGPVTVTHREIIRYFMSIPEAAQLVIQAGAMAEGGDVFVLDMGKPVKIDDLARSMVRLMGLEVQDEQHPDGDIAIEYTGLRRGEKLYEELLIGDQTTGTAHPRIMRNQEPSLPQLELDRELKALSSAMESSDLATVHEVLRRVVEGYVPESKYLEGADLPESTWPVSSTTLH